MTETDRIFEFMGDNVLCGIQQLGDHVAMLHEDERMLMSECSEKRKWEFSTSRVLARSLLGRMGKHSDSIMPGKYNAPVWPDGIAGSISHSDDICVVAVSGSGNISIGVDVQKITPLSDDLVAMILTKEEQAACRHLRDMDSNTAANIVFSAKESIYKCLAHDRALDLDFHSTIVTFGTGRFIAAIKQMNLVLEGIYRLHNEYVFTGLTKEDAECY